MTNTQNPAVPNTASGRRIYGSIFVLVLLGGCAEQVCVDTDSSVEYQLSPTGKAAAMLDSAIFQGISEWALQGPGRPDINLDCLVEQFAARFSNDVDILLMVLDRSKADFLQLEERTPIPNFTSPQRSFETGLGDFPAPIFGPAGPPGMRSYSFLGVREALPAGPSLHEIAHSWAAYLGGPEALAAQVRLEPAGHWGFSSVGGVLGGWDAESLESLGGGKYQACGPSGLENFSPLGYGNNNIPYAPLELYLMGLVGPEEVPDIQAAVSPVQVGSDGPCITFFADEIQTVSIDQIVAANGLREPDSSISPKRFKLGLVVIADDPLSDEEWMDYEEAMVCLESLSSCAQLVSGIGSDDEGVMFTPLSFYEATGGRGTIAFQVLQENLD